MYIQCYQTNKKLRKIGITPEHTAYPNRSGINAGMERTAYGTTFAPQMDTHCRSNATSSFATGSYKNANSAILSGSNQNFTAAHHGYPQTVDSNNLKTELPTLTKGRHKHQSKQSVSQDHKVAHQSLWTRPSMNATAEIEEEEVNYYSEIA